MRDNKVLVLVEVALAVALSAVLNLLAMRLPINLAGGSISLTMLPIIVVALRRGPLAGMGAGTLFGVVDLLQEPFVIFPEQAVFDYPLPYLLLGLGVGLFSRWYQKAALGDEVSSEAHSTKGSLAAGSGVVIVAVILGGILRYASHVISGVIFFSRFVVNEEYEVVQSWTDAFANSAGDAATWIYSLGYNVSYLAPSLAASLVLALIILPLLASAVPVVRRAPKTE